MNHLTVSLHFLFYLSDVDAAGKPQSGLLFGNLLWFGSVNECRNITDAHYCLSSFTISLFPQVTIIIVSILVYTTGYLDTFIKGNLSNILL